MTQPPGPPQHPWQQPCPQQPPPQQGWVPQEAPPQQAQHGRPWTPQDPQQQWVPAGQQQWGPQQPQQQWPQQAGQPPRAQRAEQQPWGFAPVPIPPPRKKSRAGLVVALVLAGVTLVAGGVVTAVATGSSDEATTRPIGNGSASTSTSEATETSSSEPTTSSTTSTSSDIENTDAQPVVALGDNPVNIEGNGAVSTSCSVPDFRTEVSAQDRFYQAVIDCLMEAWAPALHEANLPVETPRVITVGQDTSTPCGLRRWNQTALYCPNDHTIYMTARYYSEIENRTRGGVYLGQFAHEFGHAVQGLAGINTAYGDALDQAGPTSPEGLELTRRSELQATCFEGMSLAALQNGGVSNELIFPALQDSAARGDEHSDVADHGSTETNAIWINQGFTKNRVAQCNTWLSPDGDVD
ncbi:neutral zinc metallopeptidase [Saccharopolyspora griseoalba]|uniref:Neutral zinc metallopeptidase n=1 Tax=Saccharopolyspora griseoalba TaxID=1431848 RepID=A0ABW2LP63_9PSEU